MQGVSVSTLSSKRAREGEAGFAGSDSFVCRRVIKGVDQRVAVSARTQRKALVRAAASHARELERRSSSTGTRSRM